LEDDRVIECFTKLPSNKNLKKGIVYKSNLESTETFKLEHDIVKMIFIITNNGKEYRFERSKLYTLKKKKGEIYSKEFKKATWQVVVFYDDEIQIYYTAEHFAIDEETESPDGFILINILCVFPV